MFLSLKNKCTQQIAGAADNKPIVPEPLFEKCYFPDVLRKVTTIFCPCSPKSIYWYFAAISSVDHVNCFFLSHNIPLYMCLMRAFRLKGEFQQLKISFINCNYKGNFKGEKYSLFEAILGKNLLQNRSYDARNLIICLAWQLEASMF